MRSTVRLGALTLAVLALGAGLSGARADPACGGTRHRVTTQTLASTPYVTLDIGGRRGPWLIDFGATRTAVYADNWPSAVPGQEIPLTDVGLPGGASASRAVPVVEGGRARRGVGAPLGVVGTDLLKGVTSEFHFEDANDPFVIFAPDRCDRAMLAASGFLRFGQEGFFSADPASHTSGLPNVPVVQIELEERALDRDQPLLARPRRGARAWAQVDTGYSDPYWPYSVDINEPYLDELKRLVPSLTRVGLVAIEGCGREDALREVYVAPGWRLTVVADEPDPARRVRFGGFYFIVKPTQTTCGGIGPMSVPAAQLGSSFLRAFGTTVFMPSTAELWIRPP